MRSTQRAEGAVGRATSQAGRGVAAHPPAARLAGVGHAEQAIRSSRKSRPSSSERTGSGGVSRVAQAGGDLIFQKVDPQDRQVPRARVRYQYAGPWRDPR
jgi:hypothetical protein